MSEISSLTPLQQIESSLKTDITDILRGWLDGLAQMDRGAAYEAIMNEPEILHDSFQLLRTKPDLFAKVLVDEQGQPVMPSDSQKLRCGETLGKIKTLILRAAARRHFRRKLGGQRTVLVKQNREIGTVLRLMEKFGLAEPPPPKKRRLPGRGDKLYQAIRDYLIYDWQARLIPHYVQFTPEMVDEIGTNLLEIREPSELRALAKEEGRGTMTRRRPLFLGSARQMMRAGTDSIDSDILWKLWEQMGLSRLFDRADMTEARKTIAEIAATSKPAIGILMPILGDDIRLFCVFLFVAFQKLGRSEFRNIFTVDGATPWMVRVYGDRLSQLTERPPPELNEMIRVFSAILAPQEKVT
jgi:hypothetical protein